VRGRAGGQLVRDERRPIPMARGRPVREDYRYRRRGAPAIFRFFDPDRGGRRVACRDSRTAVDWAEPVRIPLEEDYPGARKVESVCGNLSTHTTAALYEALPAEQARALARRPEVHHTPAHGSWPNVAEIEPSVPASQCPDRRIGPAEDLRSEVAAWVGRRNTDQSRVVWRFTTSDARTKLRHLYPQF